jgi:hypothetical protein
MTTLVDDSNYETFLTTVRPVAIDLSGCTASLDATLYWKLRESKPRKGRREMSARYRINRVATNYFDVVGEFSIELTDPETKKRAMSIECSFLCHFHADEPINSKHAERFTESECRVAIWPYFRQFVSDTTARMGIPPVVIPVSIGRPDAPSPPRIGRARKRIGRA